MKNLELLEGPVGSHYAFGDFRVDVRLRAVYRRDDGSMLGLTPRVVDALLLFIAHPGEVLDKDRLMASLWPGLVVEENNLSQTISTLRRALGDDAQPSRYIQTVPRRGFRFVAEVRSVDDPAAIASTIESPQQAGAESASGPQAAVPSTVLPTPQRQSRMRWAWLAGGLAAIATAVALWQFTPRSPAPVVTRLTTLAVLPFKPLVADARDEVLEVGMADSLISRLSTAPDLVVRSIGSVRRFSGTQQDPIAAARELNVDWIVDGTIQRWGDQVRLTARLLRASDGAARWSGSFDERFIDVFSAQDAISNRVAAVLAPHLSPTDKARLSSVGTLNADAYQLYLAARFQSQSIKAGGLERSVQLFEQSIALDPKYALAHAGLSETFRRMVFGADADPKLILPRARFAALRALELDPALAEGHSALGWVKFWYEWDWPAAEQTFRKAIALNPNVAEAHLGLGQLMMATGRAGEGLQHAQRARELDPLSPIVNTLETWLLSVLGRDEEAQSRLQRVLAIDPDFWVAHLNLGSYQLARQDTQQGIETLRRAERLSEGRTQAATALGIALAHSGNQKEARAILNRLVGDSKRRYVSPTSMARICAALGDDRQALDWLEKAHEARDVRLAYLRVDAGFYRALQHDPRFKAILTKMNFNPP